MTTKRTARPVSGEIMSGAASARSHGDTIRDIVDAEYEIIQPAGKAGGTAAPPRLSPPIPEGMNILLDRNEPATPRFALKGGPVFWTFGFGLAAAAFWVAGGHALLRQIPFAPLEQEASLLAISGVTSRVDASGANPVLFVDGFASNDGAVSASLPPLAIDVTDNGGGVTRYKLGTSGRLIAPDARFAFSSRLDVPKNGVKTVSVTFGE
ncbi:MAG: hypothetical protein H0T56_10230 [Pseudaminobacter sp.]|nr:hypothetical protein [Pseudaminobacter sp.]